MMGERWWEWAAFIRFWSRVKRCLVFRVLLRAMRLASAIERWGFFWDRKML